MKNKMNGEKQATREPSKSNKLLYKVVKQCHDSQKICLEVYNDTEGYEW